MQTSPSHLLSCSDGSFRLACRRSLRRGGKETLMAPRGRSKKAKAEAERPLPRKLPKDDSAKVRELEKRLAEALKLKTEALRREAEALEQRTATSEILRII